MREWMADLYTWLDYGPTIAAALIGRLAYHFTEARAGRRKWWTRAVLAELWIALFCGLVAAGVADYCQIDGRIETALVAFMAYLGPRGFEAIAEKALTQIFKK